MIMLGRIKLRRAALGGLAALTLGFIAFDAATPAAAYWPGGGYHNGWRHGWSGGYGDGYGHRWGGGWREYGDRDSYGYGYGDREGYGYNDDGDCRPWRYHRPVIGSAPRPGLVEPDVAPKALPNGPVPGPVDGAAVAPAAPVVPAAPVGAVAAPAAPTAPAPVGVAPAPAVSAVPAAPVDGASADASTPATPGPVVENKDQAPAADCSAANKPALDASGAQLRSLTVNPCK
jgi:hypothetical protein